MTVFYLLVAIGALATALPVSSSRYWWIRGLDFPRLQIACVLGLLTVLWLLLDDRGAEPALFALLTLIAALCFQLWWILPYTQMHGQEVLNATTQQKDTRPTLSLLTSNVLMSNRDSTRLLDLIHQHQPDVVSILESDQWWQDQLDAGLEQYPHRVAQPLDNRYGMHVYSRLPLNDPSVQFIVEDDIPSMHMTLQLADDITVGFHVVHPTPPAPGENERSTERDVELLLLAQHLEDHREPVVVTGDLNDVAWSATTRLFRRVSGLLDPRVGRGMYNTFSAEHWYVRWPLDHVFVSEHFRMHSVQRLPDIGSDHFPILVKLVLSEVREERAHLDPDEADEDMAEETLRTDVAQEAEGLKSSSGHGRQDNA